MSSLPLSRDAGLPAGSRRAPMRTGLVCALLCAAACGGGGGSGTGNGGTGSGGGGGGTGPGPLMPPVNEWGAIPAGPRGPGEVVPAPFTSEVEVSNPGPARTATVCASMPFAWGHVQSLDGLTVGGNDTAWRVLQRWPDDSVRVAQAQWTEALAANDTRTLALTTSAATLVGPFQPHPVFAGGLPELGSDVSDRFDNVYRADVTGVGEVLQETALVRVRRFRELHRAAPGVGIDRDFLSSTFYVTEFRDEPVLLVDWVLGNDYLGADDPAGSSDAMLYPLGAVDVNRARFRYRAADFGVAYRPAQEGIGAAIAEPDGFTAHQVMAQTFVADGQTRRYRFVLLRDDPALSAAQRQAARDAARARADTPVRTLATRDSWRATHALGLLGGVGPGPANAAVLAGIDFEGWRNANHFGTWGNHGDPSQTGQTGTPRNHPLSPSLAHAVQSRDLRLLIKLEQLAWTQAVRPYHMYGLRVENADPVLLWTGLPDERDLSPESFGRRGLRDQGLYSSFRFRADLGPFAHGFSAYDEQHWSMDLLFDYWTVSGDAWAQHELQLLGECLRGLLRPVGFFSSSVQPPRAEGWCMQGFVQAFLATGDLRYRDAALDRAHDIVDRDRVSVGPHRALHISPTDPRTNWPEPHSFYMPWQHGAVLYGYLGAWKFFGDPLLLRICEDVATCVEYGWVRNVSDPNFGFVVDGLRYYVPLSFQGQPVAPDVFDVGNGVAWGDDPLGGAHTFLTAGLLMLSQTSDSAQVRARALQYGQLLLPSPLSDGELWNKWFYTVPAPFNP